MAMKKIHRHIQQLFALTTSIRRKMVANSRRHQGKLQATMVFHQTILRGHLRHQGDANLYGKKQEPKDDPNIYAIKFNKNWMEQIKPCPIDVPADPSEQTVEWCQNRRHHAKMQKPLFLA